MKLSSWIQISLLCLCVLSLKAKTPAWISQRPIDKDYYIGIGVATKQADSRDYIQFAKDAALQNLASEITVNINSEVISNMIEKSGVLEEEIKARIKTSTMAELEDYELVDTWEDKKEYWVYYRLSREIYAQNRATRIMIARQLGLDLFTKGKLSEENGNYSQALKFYIRAFSPIEKYINEPLQVDFRDREIYLGNELYSQVSSLLYNLSLQPVQDKISAKIGKSLKNPVRFAAYFNTAANEKVPVNDLPLQVNFLKGEGELVESMVTDDQGIARTTVSRIISSDKMQILEAKVDLLAMTGQDTTSFVFQEILQSLESPATKVILNVSGLTIYIETQEKNFGQDIGLKHIEPELKEALADRGYSFTDDIGGADLYIMLDVDTREGGKAFNMVTAYADLNISVTDMTTGNEVYKNALSKIKGIDLEAQKAGLKSLDNAAAELKKIIIPDMTAKF